MPDSGFTYRAFLSYSHADTPLAKGLHASLERFPLRGLAGRVTALGPVPKELRPIFRDREDFSAGGSLNEQSIAALDASAALIVLCSPHSAQSHYVNEEIRLFKHGHPERPIVPVILAGKPDGGDEECFPPALRFELDAEGQITDRPAPSPLAADAREGDGRDLAVAKVVAALIGVPSDEVYRRAERERNRQARIRNAVAASIAILAGVGGLFAYLSQKRGAVLIDTAAACTRYLPKDKAQATGPLDPLEQCKSSLDAWLKGVGSDPRDPEIAKLIASGQQEEAERLQLEASQDDETARAMRGKRAAERYRVIAATAGLADPKKAREYYAKAAKLDPDNINGMLWHAYMEGDAGNLAEAEHAYKAVLGAGIKGKDDFELYWARLGLGDIHEARDDLPGALSLYREASSEAEHLDNKAANLQRDLSVSYEKLGEVLKKQGNLPDALKAYLDGLGTFERLAAADPGDARRQRDVCAALLQVADVEISQGNLPDALEKLLRAKEIVERLAKADPGNAGWQRDLSVTHEKVGNVLMAQGNLPKALKAYRDGLAIAERLAAADPENAGWQHHLSVLHNKVGEVLKQQGNLGDAMNAFLDGLAIAERLAKADPGNAEYQRDLSVSHEGVGDVLTERGEIGAALKSYETARGLISGLAKADPGNTEWQHALAFSHAKLADVFWKQGQTGKVRDELVMGHEIMMRLTKLSRDNATWNEDLAGFEVHLAALELNDKANAAFNAGDFAKAAALRTELVDTVEKDESERNGKPGPSTAEQWGILSWYRLFTREFGEALKASERGLALAPDKLAIALNRAHALMFLGRAEEARAAYLDHKGQQVEGEGVWDGEILKDFADLKKRGLTHPQMAEIRRLFSSFSSRQH